MVGWLACAAPVVDVVDVDTEAPPEVDTGVEHVGDPIDTGWDTHTLCLNEFMPDNQSVLVEDVGTSPDWIELHNLSDEPLSLDGWWLTDDLDDDQDGGQTLPEGMVVEGGGFLLLYADGVPEAGPQHLDFKLSAKGGELALMAPDGQAQVVLYGAVESDFSVARTPDCCVGEPDCSR